MWSGSKARRCWPVESCTSCCRHVHSDGSAVLLYVLIALSSLQSPPPPSTHTPFAGWLGTKHQVTYSARFLSVTCVCVYIYKIMQFSVAVTTTKACNYLAFFLDGCRVPPRNGYYEWLDSCDKNPITKFDSSRDFSWLTSLLILLFKSAVSTRPVLARTLTETRLDHVHHFFHSRSACFTGYVRFAWKAHRLQNLVFHSRGAA